MPATERAAAAAGKPVVYLHVGAPKTGTTFLQDVLFRHREELRAAGVLYPVERFDDHFLAAVDLRDLAFYGEARPEAAGCWERVAERARGFPGTSVISHDVFAGASEEQARRAVADLAPAEVHIVYTARDLVRQLPSQWQEEIKHFRVPEFERYVAELFGPSGGSGREWFWGAHDVVDVLRRWGSGLPPNRVHVVTLPPPGAPAAVLWDRFAGLVGIDPVRYDIATAGSANPALDLAQTEVLRRVNAQLAGRMPQRTYEHVVKAVLAHRILAGQLSDPLRLPPEHYPRLADISGQWVAALRAAGYDVVGDLDELLPPPPAGPTAPRHPDTVTPEEVAASGVPAAAELLLEVAELRADLARARAEGEEAGRRLAAAEHVVRERDELPPWERIKRTVVEIGRTDRWVGRALDGYRRIRRLRPPRG